MKNYLSQIKSLFFNYRLHFFNSGSLLVSKLIIYLLYFIAIPPLIRAHGEGAYGLVAFFSTVIGYSILLENGLSYSVTWRYTTALTKQANNSEEIIKAAIPLYALLAIATFLIMSFFATEISEIVWHKPDYKREIQILAAAVGFLILDALPASVLQSHNLLFILNSNRMIADAIRVFSFFVASVTSNPLHTVMLFFLLSALLKLILDVIFCIFRIVEKQTFYPVILWQEIKSNFKLLPTMFSISMLSLLISLYDKVSMARMLSASDFAHYAFAADACSKVYVIFYAFSGTIYNSLIRRNALSRSKGKVIWGYILALFFITLFFYLPLFLWGKQFITIYLDSSFANQTMPIIRVLSISSLLYLGFSVLEANLMAKGELMPILSSYLTGFLSLVFLSSFLVGKYSVLGMGYSLISMFSLMIITILLIPKLSIRKW
jgi:O-antigen/teichoic acid export membrane protein